MQISWTREFVFLIVPTIIAIIAGPFGTYEHLSLLERSTYWFGAMTGVGAIMSIGMHLTLSHPGLARSNYWGLLIPIAAFCALPGVVVIAMLEMVFRNVTPSARLLINIYFFVFVIGAVIGAFKYPPKWRKAEIARLMTVLTNTDDLNNKEPVFSIKAAEVLAGSAEARSQDAHRDAKLSSQVHTTAFLRRLNPEIGRELITIGVKDHYLEVVAMDGVQTLLMRMSDAERELDGYPGMRIHRSHWVALPAVKAITRDGNKWTAHLLQDIDVPVSRSKAQALNATLERYRKMNGLRPNSTSTPSTDSNS